MIEEIKYLEDNGWVLNDIGRWIPPGVDLNSEGATLKTALVIQSSADTHNAYAQ